MNLKTFVVSALGLSMLGGCVIGPTHGQEFRFDETIVVTGYHRNPGGRAEVQLFNKNTETWVPIAVLTAGDTPFNADNPLYGFSGPVDWRSHDDALCFLEPDCTIAGSKGLAPIIEEPRTVKMRAVPLEYPRANLMTFDADFWGCIQEEVGDNGGIYWKAGLACGRLGPGGDPYQSPPLTLKIGHPHDRCRIGRGDCDEGLKCVAHGDVTHCEPVAPVSGQGGDACASQVECDPGFVCLDPGVAPGLCGEGRCCAQFCEPDGEPGCDAPEATCQPISPFGTIGACLP